MNLDPNLEEAIQLMKRRKKFKTEEHYINLQSSEKILVQTAGTIYAAYLQSGRVEVEKEQEYINKSVDEAIKIALKVEHLVTDAEEKVQ